MVDVDSPAEPEETGATDGRRPLQPGERYSRFGLIRRSPPVSMDWYGRRSLAIVVSTTLGLTAFFIYFAFRNGFIWSTVCFGVMAGISLLTLLVRLFFPKFGRSR